jgi:tetratricopeptide (TPR) repeat protein
MFHLKENPVMPLTIKCARIRGKHGFNRHTDLKNSEILSYRVRLWCFVAILLTLCALPPFSYSHAATARDIQKAQQQAAQPHRDRNYVEALNVRKKIYTWSRQVYGARHLQTGAAAFDLGKAQMTMGNMGPVESLFLESLSIFRTQRIRNDPNVATVLNSLATYYTQVGQVAEAQRAYTECTRILHARRATVSLLSVRYNQATLYRHIRLAQVEYAQRVADAAERKKLLTGSRNWFVKARDMLHQDLNTLNGLKFPPKDTRRHNRESTLGEIYLDLGNFQEADRLFVSAQQFWNRTYGKDTHGRDLLNLGLSRCALGQYKEALDFFRRASALAQKTLGDDNPTYPTSLAMQAMTLAHLGRFKEAAQVM